MKMGEYFNSIGLAFDFMQKIPVGRQRSFRLASGEKTEDKFTVKHDAAT